MLALRSIKRPTASRDAGVEAQHDGAGEDVQGVLLHPLVPVALIEFVTICGVPKEAGTFANLRTDGIVEVSEPAGTEFVPVGTLEFVEDGRPFGVRPVNCSNAIGPGRPAETGFGALEATVAAASARILVGSGWRWGWRSGSTGTATETGSASGTIITTESGSTGGTVVTTETGSTGGSGTAS